MQNSILEQAKVAKQDFMFQFLKKLNFKNLKLVPETVRQIFTLKSICDYLYITIIY